MIDNSTLQSIPQVRASAQEAFGSAKIGEKNAAVPISEMLENQNRLILQLHERILELQKTYESVQKPLGEHVIFEPQKGESTLADILATHNANLQALQHEVYRTINACNL
jgi:hypothetical protein